MQRAVAMVGLTLMTGGVLGVTATAASAAPTQEKAASQSVERHGDGDRDRGGRFGDDRGGRFGDRGRDRSYVAGWFPSRESCRFAGRVGEWKGKFDNPRCYQVGRRAWILKVEPNHRRGWR
jgi:hypothetical protein